MLINFNEIPLTVSPNFKGGEKEFRANMFFDGVNRIFKGRLVPGSSIGDHMHEDSCEVIFIISGRGVLTDKGKSPVRVKEGDCLYCPKSDGHTLMNPSDSEEDLVFYAVVAAQ